MTRQAPTAHRDMRRFSQPICRNITARRPFPLMWLIDDYLFTFLDAVTWKIALPSTNHGIASERPLRTASRPSS